jgi:hypothetical protein
MAPVTKPDRKREIDQLIEKARGLRHGIPEERIRDYAGVYVDALQTIKRINAAVKAEQCKRVAEAVPTLSLPEFTVIPEVVKVFRSDAKEKLRTLAGLAGKAHEAIEQLEQFVTAKDNVFGPAAIFIECQHQTDWLGLKSKLCDLAAQAEYHLAVIGAHDFPALEPQRAPVLEPCQIFLPVWDKMTPKGQAGKWRDLEALTRAWHSIPQGQEAILIYAGRYRKHLEERLRRERGAGKRPKDELFLLDYAPPSLKRYLQKYFPKEAVAASIL